MSAGPRTLAAAGAVLTFAASQAVEWGVTRAVPPGGERVVIPHLLSLSVVHNQGIAFGLLARLAPLATTVLALTVLAFLFYNRTARLAAPAGQWGLGLIIGGALANVVDRLHFGYVIDYFDVHIWPVFNLADAAIVVGAGLLLIALSSGSAPGVSP